MKLVVGCPVSHREWILPAWFEHVAVACNWAGVRDYSTVFVVAVDDPSVDAIRDAADVPVTFVPSDEPAREDERCWDRPGRYAHLAGLRNQLLAEVRTAKPDLFLSLDSDILLHPDALVDMLLLTESGFGAASSKTFMTRRGVAAPNYGNLVGYGGLRRHDSVMVAAVDVIMAIKLMTPAAYRVDYVADGFGEDLGWCRAAKRAGVRLGWSGRVCSKHVMAPEMLEFPDERCGF